MSEPTFLYKIIPSSSPTPSPLPDILPPSELDKRDNFIHLSTAKQIPGTLRIIFKDDSKVFILKIEYKNVQKDVKWEEGSCFPGASQVTQGDMFPHLYNELRLKGEDIVSVAEWERNADGWDGEINKAKESGWLIF